MTDTPTTLTTVREQSWYHWLIRGLVFLYVLVALAVFVIIPFRALDWINTPFLGGFVEHTMRFNDIGSTGVSPIWGAYRHGLRWDSQLTGVDDQPVSNAAELQAVLKQKAVGELVQMQVRREDRSLYYLVQLIQFPFHDQLTYFYIPYGVGLVYLFSGFWIFAIRRRQVSGLSFAVFAVSVALSIGCLFDLYTSHQFTYLWSLAVALVGGSIIHMALIFPQDDPILSRLPFLRYASYAVALVLFIGTATTLFDFDYPMAYIGWWQAEYALAGVGLVFTGLWILFRRMRIASPIEREQLRLLLIAGVISMGPLGLWLVITPWLRITFSPFLIVPLAIFPVGAGYTIQRYRLLNTDYVISRAVLYGALAVLIGAGYAFLVSGIGILFTGVIAPDSALISGLAIFILALVFNPVRQRMEDGLNAIFFRGERVYQERLQTFSGDLTRAVDLPSIVKVLREYVDRSLQPGRFHIYLYDVFSDQYAASADEKGKSTSDLRFSVSSAIVQVLSRQRTPIFLADSDQFPLNLQPEQTRLVLLGAQVFVPLPGRQRLGGWLALGRRLSGEPYTSRELVFLEALSDQAALAIERAQVVANVENRVREMNVLTRVAQGVNVTPTLDDIFELIYAQTTQIISADEFQLFLMEHETDQLINVFYVRDDERLNEKENRVIEGQTLEKEVIRQRRPILTDDYAREAQKRGLLRAVTNLYAWVSVPLNAGAETIGALSLGSRDSGVVYTREQLNLLQAIADQVAGAIVKARLLQETERRARQLATLNEVTRQLTSTLELEPLLHNILRSAVDILNCEAGSLLLMDEQSDELVFRVTVGPVAANLVGQRMPSGSGFVGKAVKEHRSIIVNNVQRSPEWFQKPDQQTGFATHALMVIPLEVKDRVIGVIEVINRRDGFPFTGNDESLLAAFGAQAAVAIDNARLYTFTDQALADRVEELSVMQRIDRELNTSLDTSRAMRITLEWALRQSGTTAGLVGVVQENGVRIAASEGYGDELNAYENGVIPIGEFDLQEVVETGKTWRVTLDETDKQGLLAGAHSRVIVPIQRETTTIGLIFLESTSAEPLAEEALSFLLRLSDHASIALSNAQLYSAVQAANLAKSEFVSFVAHELKNPMTSVKGFTDLLLKGVVGPVNEAQVNFLSTIAGNVERMNTLVSDLNDMSKLEVGRLRLDFKAVSLPEAVEEVVRSTRRQFEEKNQQLTVALPAGLPQVWVDRGRMVQVLVNLVSNANKYTQSGGQIVLSAEESANIWDEKGAGRVVHIWVQDNGIGISPEDQGKIFIKFFRSEDPKTREAPGTGLGLNITRSLVEMQGGRIWFESEFRKGTTFHFTVPIAE